MGEIEIVPLWVGLGAGVAHTGSGSDPVDVRLGVAAGVPAIVSGVRGSWRAMA